MKVEEKELVMKRVPPGDRWEWYTKRPIALNQPIFESLTDALNSIFDFTGETNFYLSARTGEIFIVKEVDTEDPAPPPPKKYSIYGD